MPSGQRQHWVLKEQFCDPDCAYKNRIFGILQDKLIARIPDISSQALKEFTMQMYQENGSLNIWATGGTDRGRSYGLGQWNVGNARKYLNDNCARNQIGECDYELELERQLRLLADEMADAYRRYRGNIKLAIVDHNRPASAQAGQDQCLAGATDVDDPGNDCYYKDQVLRHQKSFELR